MRRFVADEVTEKVLVRSSLAIFCRTIAVISADLYFAPDAVGNFIAEELRMIEVRVRGATIQSLEGLCNGLRIAAATGELDFPVHHGSID